MENTELRKSAFYYDLPQELIAQDPLEDRSSSRLMVLDKTTGATEHHIFKEIGSFLSSLMNNLMSLNIFSKISRFISILSFCLFFTLSLFMKGVTLL